MKVRTITRHKALQLLARYTHLRAEDLVERLKLDSLQILVN
jgi:hypothetical protein